MMSARYAVRGLAIGALGLLAACTSAPEVSGVGIETTEPVRRSVRLAFTDHAGDTGVVRVLVPEEIHSLALTPTSPPAAMADDEVDYTVWRLEGLDRDGAQLRWDVWVPEDVDPREPAGGVIVGNTRGRSATAVVALGSGGAGTIQDLDAQLAQSWLEGRELPESREATELEAGFERELEDAEPGPEQKE